MRLSDYELGWLVAILEGEGSFGFSGSNRKCHVVQINMTDEDVLYRIASLFERILGVPIEVADKYTHQHQLQYRVAVYGERARTIMRLVVTHMSYRRRQRIWQCLNGYNPPKLNVVDLMERLKGVGQ